MNRRPHHNTLCAVRQPRRTVKPAHRFALPRRTAGLRRAALSNGARPLRFAVVGGVCGLVQLAFLILLKWLGLAAIPANVGAYLLSAQLNFLFSNRFIWHDRWSQRATGRDLLQRWLSFHGSIAGTFLLSQAVFITARVVVPDVLASALGIGVSAVANFLIQDRLTFRRIHARPALAVVPDEETRRTPWRPDGRASA
jgi:putative flippase GtrA